MERDPFRIEGPACISFSGGRTSGYMLWRILKAHGGKLPEDVKVIFANTGKEMPETLDFVKECGKRWGVEIVWVEYQDAEPRWRVVDYETASTNGEPYEALIRRRQYLPNPVSRFCTIDLKIRPMGKYLKSIGFEGDTENIAILGIRADERHRVAKIGYARCPLAAAGITAADVGRFWQAQPFDLRLPNMNGKTMHGNCDLCFLKGADQLLALIREQPKRAEWWMKMEALALALASKPDGARFRKDRPSYAAMHKMALNQGEMFKFDDEALQDCACTD